MRRLLLLGIAAGLALAVASPTGAATIAVKITKSGFSPKTFTIDFGDKVTWTNADSTDHQVVADNGSFASPIMKPRATYTFEFKTSGRYPYHDAIHPSLRGTITVKGPPPSLTLGASQPIIVYGAQITLSGVVSNQKSGESVTLYSQPYGQASLVQLAVVLSGTGGGFSYTTAPTILTSYQARWKSASSAPVSVQVKPKLSFLPRSSRFYAKVTGGGSFAGKSIYLQRRSAFGQWVTVQKLTLGPLSGRIFSITRRKGTGYDYYRVYLTVNQAGAGYLDGSSGTQRVRKHS
jgi:plastocyanin